MKYCSRTEIVAMIIDTANGGATKTKMMYKSFLSYHQLKEYLTVLIENDLIEYLNGTQTFRTTEKGLKYLKMHNRFANYYILLPKPTNSFYFFIMLNNLLLY